VRPSPDPTVIEDEPLLKPCYRRTIPLDGDISPRAAKRRKPAVLPAPTTTVHDDYLFQPSRAALHFLAPPVAMR